MKKDVKNIMHSSFDKTNKPLYICLPVTSSNAPLSFGLITRRSLVRVQSPLQRSSL